MKSLSSKDLIEKEQSLLEKMRIHADDLESDDEVRENRRKLFSVVPRRLYIPHQVQCISLSMSADFYTNIFNHSVFVSFRISCFVLIGSKKYHR